MAVTPPCTWTGTQYHHGSWKLVTGLVLREDAVLVLREVAVLVLREDAVLVLRVVFPCFAGTSARTEVRDRAQGRDSPATILPK